MLKDEKDLDSQAAGRKKIMEVEMTSSAWCPMPGGYTQAAHPYPLALEMIDLHFLVSTMQKAMQE